MKIYRDGAERQGKTRIQFGFQPPLRIGKKQAAKRINGGQNRVQFQSSKKIKHNKNNDSENN